MNLGTGRGTPDWPRGVLFDWRGTLFHDLSDADWVRTSASAIGRTLSDAEIDGINA